MCNTQERMQSSRTFFFANITCVQPSRSSLFCHTTQVADHKALQRRTTLEHSDALDLLRNEHAHHTAELSTRIHQLESSLHTAQVFPLSFFSPHMRSFLCVETSTSCATSTRTTRQNYSRECTNSSPLFTARRFFFFLFIFQMWYFSVCGAFYAKIHQLESFLKSTGGFSPLFFSVSLFSTLLMFL